MELIKSAKKLSLSFIIVSLLLGIAFTFFPEICIKYISTVIGASLIVFGAVGVINSVILDKAVSTLITSVITICAGIIICTKYFQIISFIVALIGVMLIVFGLFNLFTSIKVITISGKFGWVTLILSALSVVFGIISITKTQETTTAVFRFLGIALIVYSVLDIISYFQVKKLYNDIKAGVDIATDEEIETSGEIIDNQ